MSFSKKSSVWIFLLTIALYTLLCLTVLNQWSTDRRKKWSNTQVLIINQPIVDRLSLLNTFYDGVADSASSAPAASAGSDLSVDLRLPGALSNASEPVLCSSLRVPFDRAYLTGLSHLASVGAIHHVAVYHCREPGFTDRSVWNCESPTNVDGRYDYGEKCRGDKDNMVFAWDWSPKTFTLPEDTAYFVGQDTEDSRYIVLNIHFARPLHRPDFSGVRIHLTRKRPSKRAGLLTIMKTAPVPPMSVFYNDALCQLPSWSSELHPYGYYMHTHHLGKVIAGYKVDRAKAMASWDLIGKQFVFGDRAYFDVQDGNMVLRPEDLLAIRCTMVSERPHVTEFDSMVHTEMCLIMLYYFTLPDSPGVGSGSGRHPQGERVAKMPSDLDCVFMNETLVAEKIGYFPTDASQRPMTSDATVDHTGGIVFKRTHPLMVDEKEAKRLDEMLAKA